ncbi:MAG TPA: hypothetical protein DCS21_02810 [Gammaproteobacteria bacterium]|nr:hypothetical protein [Gammaproteobacteria bacterium]
MANIPNAGNYRNANNNQPFQHGGNPQRQQQQPAQPLVAQAHAGESSTWPWIIGLIGIGVLALMLFKFPWLLIIGVISAAFKGLYALTASIENTVVWILGLGLGAGVIALLIYFPFLWVGVAVLVMAAIFG